MKIFKKFLKQPIDFVLLMFLVLFSFGQLQRIQLPDDVAFYLHDVLIALWLGFNYSLMKGATGRREAICKIAKDFLRKNKIILYFLIWAGFSSLLGSFFGRVNFKSLLYIGRLIIYGIFIINLNLFNFKSKKEKALNLRNGLTIAGLFISLMGILQYIFLPDTRFLNIFGWDTHYYRLIGPLLDPAFMGMVAVLSLVGVEKIKNSMKSVRKNLTGFLIAELLLMTTIALTFSRSSYLSLGIVLGIFLLKQKQIRYFLLGIVFLMMLPLLPKPGGAGVDLGRTETLEFRIANSQSGLKTLQGSQWIWGRGLFNNDNLKPSYTNQHAQVPDNLLVFLINGVGIGGSLLLLMAFLKLGREWWGEDWVWVVGLIAVLAHSMFNNTFLQPFIFLMLWGGKEIKLKKNLKV